MLNQPTPEPERITPRRRLLSWWWVWLPVIVVVTLWIGGWSFGNYGGPWTSQPRAVQPQISDPGNLTLNVNGPDVLFSRAVDQLMQCV